MKGQIPQLKPEMLTATPAPTAVAYFYAQEQAQAWHSHATVQLTWCSRGALTIHTEQASWTLPPWRGLWIPSGLPHQTHAQAGTQTHNLYLSDAGEKKCIEALCPLRVTPLVHQLVNELHAQHPSRNTLILPLLFNELSQATPATVGCLPRVTEPRLRALTGMLLAQPDNNATLETLSQQLGTTSRTIGRLFRQHTGLTFAQWRQQLTIMASIHQLSQGVSVEEIALRQGYCNGSALIAMFSKVLGMTPQRYFALKS
jgi:AraC-like DNA-binding protein